MDDGYPPMDNSYPLMDEEYATSNNSNKPVKVKIIVPMEDRKNAEKIKIMAMLKGEIKSEVIEDVKKEFDKIGGYTIERIFAFDRNTDMGQIQVGDRFHACVIGQDLNPPEGSECEKRLIKNLDRPNPLAVHFRYIESQIRISIVFYLLWRAMAYTNYCFINTIHSE